MFAGFAAAVLAGCGGESNKVTVLDAQCEVVAKSEQGSSVVKCPVTEQLTEIQGKEANSMFMYNYEPYNINDAAADTENVYVEVLNVEQPTYRVMVKNPVLDGNAMYAVEYIVVVPAEPAAVTE